MVLVVVVEYLVMVSQEVAATQTQQIKALVVAVGVLAPEQSAIMLEEAVALLRHLILLELVL